MLSNDPFEKYKLTFNKENVIPTNYILKSFSTNKDERNECKNIINMYEFEMFRVIFLGYLK